MANKQKDENTLIEDFQAQKKQRDRMSDKISVKEKKKTAKTAEATKKKDKAEKEVDEDKEENKDKDKKQKKSSKKDDSKSRGKNKKSKNEDAPEEEQKSNSKSKSKRTLTDKSSEKKDKKNKHDKKDKQDKNENGDKKDKIKAKSKDIDGSTENEKCENKKEKEAEEEKKLIRDKQKQYQNKRDSGFDRFHDTVENCRLGDSVSNFQEGTKDQNHQFEEEESWSAHNNFFADSPYYDAFVEKELQSSQLLSVTLNEISSKTETLKQAGLLFCNAMRSLAFSCQLKSKKDDSIVDLKRDALGPNMASALERMGEVLSEIATAQETMFHGVGSSFHNLEAHAANQMQMEQELHKEAKNKTESSEQTFHTYLIGKESNSKKTSHHLTSTLQNIRVVQSAAELERFKLVRTIIDSQHNRTYELSQRIQDFFQKLQTTQQYCSDLMNELIPVVEGNVGKCSKLLKKYEEHDEPLWNNREKSIVQKWKEETFLKSRLDGASNNTADGKKIDQELAENEAKFWDLPDELASSSRFPRATAPGVLVEGWLYEQSCSTFATSWNRRWFVVKHDGVFRLQRESEKSNSIVKIKICDVVLCTVREVPSVASSPRRVATTARFAFELIVTNQKPIVLQARGPKELRMWMDGIQSAIAYQLAKGNPDSGDLNQSNGSRSRSSEVGATMMKKGLSIFQLTLDGLSDTGETDESDEEDEDDSYSQKLLIKKVMHANPVCADCGKTSPDWVSLNLGVLVCLECSGVHRSLGVHVSQVRSLTLDSLSDSEASVFLELGNERMNKIFERQLNATETKHNSCKKPKSNCSRHAREEWIKCKYVKKDFVGLENFMEDKGPSEKVELASKLLYKRARKADVFGIAQCIAFGATVDWEDTENGNETPLKACTELMEEKRADQALVCAKLLLLNGAKTDKLEDAQRKLLELKLQ